MSDTFSKVDVARLEVRDRVRSFDGDAGLENAPR